MAASRTLGVVGGHDAQPWDWKSSTTERGWMSRKQAPVWTWPGSFSRDMAHARGIFFLRRKIFLRIEAILAELNSTV